MTKLDAYEAEVLAAFDQGALKSVATPAELDRFRAAARATNLKADLKDPQANSPLAVARRVAAHKRPPSA